MRAIGLRVNMDMDMRGSVYRERGPSHEASFNAAPRFPEEVFKGGNINGLRADSAAIALDGGKRALVAFGPFVFDRTSRLLARDGVEVPLPPRVLGVLALLVEHRGQLVGKQELIGAVWRDAFVTETSLAEAISVLRQTLGDDPQRPTYIQTLHRRGYRFIAEVRDVPPVDVPAKAAGLEELNRRGRLHPEEPAANRGFRLQTEETLEDPGSRLQAEGSPEARRVVAYAAEAAPRLSLVIPWTVALIAITVAASAVWKYLNTAAPLPRPTTRFALALPAGITLSLVGGSVAVSRDGTVIAFSGCRGAECGIYLRPLSQSEPTLVAGTSGGAAPFFSPDGRWLGYFARGQLFKIALAGGSPVALATAPEPLGAAWMRDGQIVFAASTNGGLSIVSENGGSARTLTEPGRGGSHRWPDALPDGSAIVFTVLDDPGRPDQQYAGIVSTRTPPWARLLDDVSSVRAGIPGYLLAQRGTDLVGVRFEGRTRSVSGLPAAVAPGAFHMGGTPQFAVAETGTVAIGAAGGHRVQIVLDWIGELRHLIPMPTPALLR
jgi:DNA-binding winged helix-turn-helix (wHTH) protein